MNKTKKTINKTHYKVLKNNLSRLNFWVDKKLNKSLEEISDKEGVSKSELIRKILKDYIKNLCIA